MRAMQLHYTMLPTEVAGGREAAEKARDKMLHTWAPVHWHLDSVGVSDKYVTVTFTAVLAPEDAALFEGG
jgi:hypothetical protein